MCMCTRLLNNNRTHVHVLGNLVSTSSIPMYQLFFYIKKMNKTPRDAATREETPNTLITQSSRDCARMVGVGGSPRKLPPPADLSDRLTVTGPAGPPPSDRVAAVLPLHSVYARVARGPNVDRKCLALANGVETPRDAYSLKV